MTQERYDYVVVGGGSAGCVVAATLSEDPDVRVLLLEAGDRAEANPETLAADGYKTAFANDRLIWERFSVPQERCGRQRLFLGSGTGLGGSGSVNGMVYIRGAREDFDEWPPGWRWDDVAPDFAAIEAVLRPHQRAPTRFTEACIQAARESGFSITTDMNDGNLSGVLGYEWMNYEDAERRSSYVAFLRPALDRPNLTVKTRARGCRITFDEDRCVTAVVYEADGRLAQAQVAREAIVCCGALESPKLLMLSGIGPRRDLERLGIEVIVDAPGVGANLHDHPNVTLFFLGNRDVDCFYPQLYGFDRANPALPLAASQADTCYVFYPARSSLREAAMRIVPTKLPGWLYRIRAVRRTVRSLIGSVLGLRVVERWLRRVWGIVVILGKPLSRGSLRLASTAPSDPAVLDPAYFDDARDMETMLRGVDRARALAGAPSLATFGNRAVLPGPRQRGQRLGRWIEQNAMTTYHYAGTCRMGNDPASVVSGDLRVRGVRGLRVADASVVPTTPVSAMNAPSMLVGYRAALAIRSAQDTDPSAASPNPSFDHARRRGAMLS